MNIDDAMLARVMSAHGITSKTKAVDFALRELDRRSELKRLLSTSMGFTDSEIVSAFDTSYDLPALRVAENPAAYGKGAASAAAHADSDPSSPVKYAKKPRTRR